MISTTNDARADAIADRSESALTGTERRLAAVETVTRMQSLFAPMGITRVANVTGLDNIGIPVTMVCRPNARSLAVSQGKGVDLDSARASGIMEAVELYHAERVSLPLKLGSWNDLRFSLDMVAVELLPRVSDSMFHPDFPLLWVQGLDLLRGKSVWLPFELVHTNFSVPLPTGSGCFVMSSNGLGSGNHPGEAIRHAVCEVVERDAAALFRLRPLDVQDERRVDLASVGDPVCRRLLERFDRADVAVGVWDITSEVKLPAYRCVILDRDPSPLRPLGPAEGSGCSPRREIALSRALTEAAQARLTLISGARDDNDVQRYERTQQADLIGRARHRLERPGHWAFESSPNYDNRSLDADVACVLNALSAAGFREAVVVDLQKPEFAIPVVRVVVPGLEPYHHIDGCVPGGRAWRLLRQLATEGTA